MNILIIIACLVAAPPEQPYKIGIAHFPPMIVIDRADAACSGSDYDMFEQLVDDPDIAWENSDYEYVIVSSFGSLMKKVENGEVDVAISGISITHDRLRKMHFSQPYKNSGQRIMIPPSQSKTSIWSFLSRFMRVEILFSVVAFIVNCLFFGILLWIVERKPKGEGKMIGDGNIQTIEHGVLAAFDTGTTIGYGRNFPITRLGQLIGFAMFFCGAILVGDVISTLTTNKIVHRLEGEINSPHDLKGKIVAVVDGTTSEKLVKEYNPAQILECKDFYKAVVEMRLGNAEAVVADDPVILNYVKENPEHGEIAGLKFYSDNYGIAFGINADRDIVKKFSIAIARLRESGKLALIENQWYGE